MIMLVPLSLLAMIVEVQAFDDLYLELFLVVTRPIDHLMYRKRTFFMSRPARSHCIKLFKSFYHSTAI